MWRIFTGVVYLVSEELDESVYPEQNGVMVSLSGIPGPVVGAVEELRNHMEALHNDEKFVVFVMGVNIDNGRATIVPIPTIQNVRKMKEQVGQLPDGIQDAIIKNVPEQDMKAIDEIWSYLSQTGEREKEMADTPANYCPRTQKEK
jgi:hypothetical protein